MVFTGDEIFVSPSKRKQMQGSQTERDVDIEWPYGGDR